MASPTSDFLGPWPGRVSEPWGYRDARCLSLFFFFFLSVTFCTAASDRLAGAGPAWRDPEQQFLDLTSKHCQGHWWPLCGHSSAATWLPASLLPFSGPSVSLLVFCFFSR